MLHIKVCCYVRGDSSVAGEERLVGEQKCSGVEIVPVAALAAIHILPW